MNFYKRHLGDYAKDTGHLTMLEHGAYALLLDRYYSTEAPIPAADAHRVARARSREERDAVDSVLREFFSTENGCWRNKRADAELARASAQRETNRELGKLGGRPCRKTESVLRPETESVLRPETESVLKKNPSQTPDSREGIQPTPATQGPPLPGGRTRGERLPAGWSPDAEGLAFAERHGLTNGAASLEADRFRDYWAAQPAAKGRKTDWPATWRNWVRRAVESRRPAAAAGNGHEPEWRREQRARNVAFLGPAASPEARAAVAEDRARKLGHVVEITATELSNGNTAALG